MAKIVKLSDDIMELIFFKLPISSLIRFKSVSRAWNDLFSDPTFMHQQYTKNLMAKRDSSTDSSTTFLVYTHQYMPNLDAYFSLVSISHAGGGQLYFELEDTFRLPFFPRDPQLFWSGPVLFYPAGFGIYCLFQFCNSKTKLALWNPAIGELTELFCPTLISEPGCYDYGFAHVEYKDCGFSYKVGLVHVGGYDLNKDSFCLSIELYSSSENSWQCFKNVYCEQAKYLKWQHSGTNLNGKFYLLPWFYGKVRGIVTFDMTTHEFGSIEVPSFLTEEGPEYGFPDLVLTKFDEKSLCLLVYKRNNVRDVNLEAWVYMEHDGSWILKSSVGPVRNPMKVSVFGINRSTGVLLKEGDKLSYCRYGLAKLETLADVVKSREYEFNLIVEYEESIVSFKGTCDQRSIKR